MLALFFIAVITGTIIAIVQFKMKLDTFDDDMTVLGLESALMEGMIAELLHLPLSFCGVTELLMRDEHTKEFNSSSVTIQDESFSEFSFIYDPMGYRTIIMPKESRYIMSNIVDEYLFATFYSLQGIDDYIGYYDLDKDGRLDVMREHSSTLPTIGYIFMENNWIEVHEWLDGIYSAKIQKEENLVDVVFSDGRWVVSSNE